MTSLHLEPIPKKTPFRIAFVSNNFYSFIAISDYEWRSWRINQEIRSVADRWVNLDINNRNQVIDPEALNTFFMSLPDVPEDTEQHILIVKARNLESGSKNISKHTPDRIWFVPIERVISIFALTQRHSEIIKLRETIELDAPIFEKEWIKFRGETLVTRRLKIGDHLLSLASKNQNKTILPYILIGFKNFRTIILLFWLSIKKQTFVGLYI